MYKIGWVYDTDSDHTQKAMIIVNMHAWYTSIVPRKQGVVDSNKAAIVPIDLSANRPIYFHWEQVVLFENWMILGTIWLFGVQIKWFSTRINRFH